MDHDRISGTAKNLGGTVEKGVGSFTENPKTHSQGKLNQAAGAAQDLYGQTADVARDATTTFDKGLRNNRDPANIRLRLPLLVLTGCLAGCTGRSENPRCQRLLRCPLTA